MVIVYNFVFFYLHASLLSNQHCGGSSVVIAFSFQLLSAENVSSKGPLINEWVKRMKTADFKNMVLKKGEREQFACICRVKCVLE